MLLSALAGMAHADGPKHASQATLIVSVQVIGPAPVPRVMERVVTVKVPSDPKTTTSFMLRTIEY